MFKIKICGVTSVADAALAVEAGADAIGLNFYPKSPRCVTLEVACEIAGAAGQANDGTPSLVGVFVNATVEEVHRTAEVVGLDYVQIHGDEPPEYFAELVGLKAVRAFRCRDEGLAPVQDYLARCSLRPRAVLIDAYSPNAYGGTGEVVDWPALRSYDGQLNGIPLILAGGLTAENVAAAIETARPMGVDTASGVESSPGVKDSEKTRGFVAEAKRAFREADGAQMKRG